MITKYLEKKTELIPGESQIDFKNPIELEYFLLESEVDDSDGLLGKKVYGIEIVKKVNSHRTERKTFQNVSSYKSKTRRLISTLADNSVTPVSLPFVLEDIIGL